MSFWMKRFSAAAPLLLLIAVAACAAQAQRQATAEPTPVMLRRMAEAVEGHRTGAPVWVVIGTAPPHSVVGVRARREDADALRLTAAFPAAVFGPFLAPRDPDRVGGLLISCHRAADSADDRTVCARAVRLDSARSIALVLRTRAGEVRSFPVPEGVDAMFLSASSVRKFVLPYYTRVEGLEGAQRIGGRLRDGLAAAAAEVGDASRARASMEEIERRFRTSVLTGCFHDGRSMYDPAGVCPHSLFRGGPASMEIVARTAHGEVRMPLPAGTEVVVFSLSAGDKFVIPYLVSTQGVEAASATRQGWIEGRTVP
jgi:hypothetical protein